MPGIPGYRTPNFKKKTICTHFWAHVGLYSRERLPKYAYGHIAFLLSTTFFKYGSESSTGTKVEEHESYFCGVNVPQVRKLHGAIVLGTIAPVERKFLGTKVLGLFAPRERLFHVTKVSRKRKFSLWTFRSRERKCRGTKSRDTSKTSASEKRIPGKHIGAATAWNTPALFSWATSPSLNVCLCLAYSKPLQELSYCQQIARKLRTQYVEGIYDNPVILKSRLWVTQGHWKRNHWVDDRSNTTYYY